MQRTSYIVAGHRFTIEHKQCNMPLQLPSYEPFIDSDGGEPLFVVTIDDSIVPAWEGKKVGIFPCPSATFEVYRQGETAYRILILNEENTPCAFILIDTATHTTTVTTRGDEQMRYFGLNNAIMLSYTFATAEQQTLLMHSSVVENSGRGYMFTGASGRGKSTHSDLWTTHIKGSTLINDDNPVVRIAPDGTPTVYGSPWSGKRDIYKNVAYPIGGIASIVQKPHNSIRKESTLVAFGIMLSSCSTIKFDKRVHTNICKTLSKMLEKIDIYTLECLPNAEAAQLSSNTLGV
ncbi:MAG: hypothetical protein IKV17_00265 [Bacteroidaceae bacterium]|nr:hypothetical protein [Bacteroidaceae bacterium]